MIQPCDQYLAIRPSAYSPSDTIVLPQKTAEEFMRGEVLAVGPGARLENGRRPMSVQAGDIVLFRKRSALAWFDPLEKDFLLIEEDDVLGVEEAA